jgi:hypothetical protein
MAEGLTQLRLAKRQSNPIVAGLNKNSPNGQGGKILTRILRAIVKEANDFLAERTFVASQFSVQAVGMICLGAGCCLP